MAGGADGDVRVGDIVVANGLLQHDMDASPLFPRFEVPLTGLSWFAADLSLTTQLKHAAQQFLLQDFMQEINDADRAEFKLKTPRLHCGLIASGDEFIDCDIKLSSLKQHLPALLAVEMEGAAVAQVCHEFGVPFAVVRTISDDANGDAAINFTRFIEQVARCYARNILRRFCASLAR
ncbi:5'-methylthioadenosine/adenosylhomocysteine nucleosidase [Undibacterium arcticum]